MKNRNEGGENKAHKGKGNMKEQNGRKEVKEKKTIMKGSRKGEERTV